MELDSTKYFPTFPILYKFNKELYFGTLYYNILKQIKQKFNKLKFQDDKDNTSKIEKSKKKIEDLLVNKEYKDKKQITFLNNLKDNIDVYFGTKFYDYIITILLIFLCSCKIFKLIF